MKTTLSWFVRLLSALFVASGIAGAQAACSAPKAQGEPWQVDRAVAFQTPGLAVDADGAPNSYMVDGTGLSHTCDGVVAIVDGKRVTPKSDPAHWVEICLKAWNQAKETGDYSHVAIFGFLADTAGPVVQQPGDPLPGKAYISTTTLEVPGTPRRTQRHWVDATRIPYVVLSPNFAKRFHVQLGDLAVVYRPQTGQYAFAVFGDTGGLGEASVKLHFDLGSDPLRVRNGVTRAARGIDDPVLTLVFPGVNVPARLDAEAWAAEISERGKKELATWGGLKRLQNCAVASAVAK